MASAASLVRNGCAPEHGMAAVPSLGLHTGSKTIFGEPRVLGLEVGHALLEHGGRHHAAALDSRTLDWHERSLEGQSSNCDRKHGSCGRGRRSCTQASGGRAKQAERCGSEMRHYLGLSSLSQMKETLLPTWINLGLFTSVLALAVYMYMYKTIFIYEMKSYRYG